MQSDKRLGIGAYRACIVQPLPNGGCMFNVITNRVINDQPLELTDALSLANQFIYVGPRDVNQARADFANGAQIYKVVYGFTQVNIEVAK